jgi:hypothetical protein
MDTLRSHTGNCAPRTAAYGGSMGGRSDTAPIIHRPAELRFRGREETTKGVQTMTGYTTSEQARGLRTKATTSARRQGVGQGDDDTGGFLLYDAISATVRMAMVGGAAQEIADGVNRAIANVGPTTTPSPK